MESLSLKNVKWWVVFGILLAVCFLTYNNSLHNPFMMDDRIVFSDVKFKNIKFLLNSFIYPSQNPDHGESFQASELFYRPMTFVISMLSYLAFGDEPYGYHVSNLFLFTLMCFTLYVFIDLLFKDRILAFITSILFAVHPINVFFVNYNTSGIHSVRFIFMFLSVILFLKAFDATHKNILHVISLFCFGVALLCHETSMVLPFYILFLSIFVSKNNVRSAVFKAWPFFLMLLFFLLFRFYCTRMPGNLSAGLANLNLHQIILLIAAFSKLIYSYFAKLLFPDFVLFSWNVVFMNKFIFIWMGGLLLLFTGWYMLLRADAKSVPFFCATWMLLGFLPVTVASMSSNLGLIIEPQWLTFSSMGFFLFIAWGGLQLYARVNKWIMCLMFVFVLIGWGMITRYNNWIWADELRFFDYWGENLSGEGIEARINDLVMSNMYMNKKDYYLASYYYRKVTKYAKKDDLAAAYSNLGMIDMRRGYLKRAEEEFLLSIKSDPNDPAVLNNLAIFYINQSNYKLAKPLLLRALELNKYSVEARLNLALIFVKELNDKEAERIYKENLNVVPYEGHSLLGLVQIYVRSNNVMDVRRYSQLLIKNDLDPVILTELGSILAQFGQLSTALDAFNQAIRMDPNYKQAYLELGKLLANSRMYSEAVHIWQIGEKVDPHEQEFKDNISKAMALKSVSR